MDNSVGTSAPTASRRPARAMRTIVSMIAENGDTDVAHRLSLIADHLDISHRVRLRFSTSLCEFYGAIDMSVGAAFGAPGSGVPRRRFQAIFWRSAGNFRPASPTYLDLLLHTPAQGVHLSLSFFLRFFRR
jgi:hypothetical protein